MGNEKRRWMGLWVFLPGILLALGPSATYTTGVLIYVPEGDAVRWYDGHGGPELGGFLLAGGTNAVGRVTFQDRNNDGTNDFIVPQSDAVRFYDGVTGLNMAPGGFLTAGGASVTGGIALQERTGGGSADYLVPESDGAVRFYDSSSLLNIGQPGAPPGPGGFLTRNPPIGKVLLQDRNGDGVDDFVVAEGPGPDIRAVRFYSGTAPFGNFAGFVTGGTAVGGVALQDRNGDGFQDYVVPESDALRIYDGTDFVNRWGFFTVNTVVGGIALWDLNGDGFQDYLVPESGPSGNAVRFYDGQTLTNGVAGWGGGFLTRGSPSGGVVVVPEPTVLGLLALGLAGIVGRRSRNN